MQNQNDRALKIKAELFCIPASVLIALLVGCDGQTSKLGTANQRPIENAATPTVTPPVSSAAAAAAATATATAPGGLYVGFYFEDPSDNPEDPTLGTVFLNLPEGDSRFQGNMSFSYVGCQTENVGKVSGEKSTKILVGNWSGALDGVVEKGAYTGAYKPTTNSYAGTYTVDGGKKFRIVPNCVQYYVASKGTWQIFPLNRTLSEGSATAQGIAVVGTTVRWYPPSGDSTSLVSLIDQQRALRNENKAVIVQAIIFGGNTFTLPSALTPGTTYVVSVVSRNTLNQIYTSNKVFVK